MARSKNGMGPNEGKMGIASYYMRKGQLIMRPSFNNMVKRAPTYARAKQMSKMINLIMAWRHFNKELRNCFENKKPGATDYSGFLAANLPEARVFLPKGSDKEGICVMDHFYVSMGSLTPTISVEESGDWMMSDIRLGDRQLNADSKVWHWTRAMTDNNNHAFHDGDELIFLRMCQRIDINNREPKIYPYVCRLRLDGDNTRTLHQELMMEGEIDGFQMVDGRLAARRADGDLVAWIHMRHERDDTVHVTTQRLVGNNPMLPKYMSEDAIMEAVTSFKPRGSAALVAKRLTDVKVSVTATSNDVNLGTVVGGGTFAPGAVVTLRAVPNAGARFVIWDDGFQAPERVFPATTGASFKAIFIPSAS